MAMCLQNVEKDCINVNYIGTMEYLLLTFHYSVPEITVMFDAHGDIL